VLTRHEPLVIFDCDGVLVDSEALVVKIESELLREVGVELTPLEVAAFFVGLSEIDMNRLISERWGVELPPEYLDRKTAAIRDVFDSSLRPVTGMSALLAGLTQARCVASSATPERIRHSLALTGLLKHFEHLFSAAEVEHGKPAPDLFLRAASMLGARPSRCVVVEDSPSGVAAGVAAGMCVIGFTAGGHCPPTHADALRECGAAYVARDATELAACLDQYLPRGRSWTGEP
jgi:HAD superfamily hydrolase (TIGR01509 family)